MTPTASPAETEARSSDSAKTAVADTRGVPLGRLSGRTDPSLLQRIVPRAKPRVSVAAFDSAL